MSTLVLARKYRPKNFAEIVGQEAVVQALSNALARGRLHHAYLFTGTRGVGKTTVSRVLAKSLNCVGPDGTGGITAEPCGVCDACRDIDAGRFVDYTELDAASNRGVDEVQALLEQAVYKPVQGRFKVFMIDEVHMLTGHAFNAMLKTLEEPPEYLKFVLATTDPQKVPVTVLSRCLQFNLRPMAPETIREHLARVLETEGVPADAGALRMIARGARGSMRDALSLTDQSIAFGAGRIEEAAVRAMLGSAGTAVVLGLVDALSRGEGATVVAACDAVRAQGLSAASLLEEMSAVLQRMAVLQAVSPAQAAAMDGGDDPDAAEVRRLADALPAAETQLLYGLALHGRTELGLAPDEYAALVMVLLRFLAFRPASAAAEKKTALTAPPVDARPNAAPAFTEIPLAAGPADDATDKAPSEDSRALRALNAPSAVDAARAASSANGAMVTGTPGVDPARSAAMLAPVHAGASEPPSAPTPRPAGRVLPVVAPSAGPRTERIAPTAAPMRTSVETDAHAGTSVPVRVQPESTREAPAAGGTSALEATPDGDFWFDCVSALVKAEAVTALVRELALQSQLLARDTGHWLLRVERESLNQPGSRERLRNALRAAGHEVELGVEIGRVTDSPARRMAEAARERQAAAEAAILADPFVQDMMRDFGARIVPGSIKPVVT